ncbi:hypothetical protein IVB27_08725 [Bradyrhizobium sp. 197]|uniref:hypothetical protein n=1 Tax=unclassified Bradyrhizobium TaxID=2631580 RepID=UPI001FFAD390|nr:MULTISPECIES: hypothetical protein [unclassified Bradyrhizobium]MCK1474889.1 hypothetical protein [Bradyrhizobium sp. 197]UPJ57638.1 hypothetical protein IVB24_34665 [Bradyrhizobium sp. 192]
MARTRVTEDHFQVDENEVTHTRPNDRWPASPGRPEPAVYSPGMLGSVLPNGDDYWREAVEPIALKLLAARPDAQK